MHKMLLSLAILLTFFPATLAGADDAKKDKPKELKIAGLWKGAYAYGADDLRPPVEFTVAILQDGDKFSGLLHEQRTFGGGDPLLHAVIQGKFDPEKRTFTLTKTYDGTGGTMHAVEYTGTFSEKGDNVEGGAWSLPGVMGTFTLAKQEKVKAGKLFGLWSGTNEAPAGSEIPASKMTAILMHQGDKGEIIGFVREPRDAPEGTNPWFHATITGSFDEKSGEFKLVKKYDGTSGATSEETYSGKLGDDGKLTGKRTSGDVDVGQFKLQTAKTLE